LSSLQTFVVVSFLRPIGAALTEVPDADCPVKQNQKNLIDRALSLWHSFTARQNEQKGDGVLTDNQLNDSPDCIRAVSATTP
jgi:hypothetical protein